MAVVAAALAGCSDGPSGPFGNEGPVARLVIAPDSVSIPAGQTMRLEAVLLDARGGPIEGRAIRWESSDTLRVKVAATGVITASSVGWSLVSAVSEGKADTVKVIVTP